MELRHLEAFRAVAGHANVTRAAAQLGVAQPALSLQLKRLETELGVVLFERTSRGVKLTEAGVILLEDAIDVAIATLPRAVDERIVARRLFRDVLVAVVPEGHPLAAQASVSPAELAEKADRPRAPASAAFLAAARAHRWS